MDINYNCPVNKLGYGTASRQILRALMDNGNGVSLFPINRPTRADVDEVDIPYINSSLEKAKFYNDKAPSLRIWHQNDLATKIGHGPAVAFPFFELDSFSELEVHHLKNQDAIFVASQWAKNVVQAHVSVPTFIVPLGVDVKVFNPSIVKAKEGNAPTVFFNCGKWEIRKGHDLIVAAFNLAFKPEDNVELRMMNHNSFLTQEQTARWHDIYLGTPLGEAGKIHILGRVDKHEEVARMMAEADCGVFPYRAEGWNLELLEMMALGKQVIATNYSAPTEYLTPDNSLLIEPEGLEPAYDGIWFDGQGKWASLGDESVQKMADYMAYVHINHKKVNHKGVETARKFTWHNTANLITQHLRGI